MAVVEFGLGVGAARVKPQGVAVYPVLVSLEFVRPVKDRGVGVGAQMGQRGLPGVQHPDQRAHPTPRPGVLTAAGRGPPERAGVGVGVAEQGWLLGVVGADLLEPGRLRGGHLLFQIGDLRQQTGLVDGGGHRGVGQHIGAVTGDDGHVDEAPGVPQPDGLRQQPFQRPRVRLDESVHGGPLGMAVAGDHPRTHVVPAGRLDSAAGHDALGPAVQDQRQHQPRIKRGPAPPIGAVDRLERGQVQLPHQRLELEGGVSGWQ